MKNTNTPRIKAAADRLCALAAASLLLIAAAPCHADAGEDLTALSLEALMQIEITSVARKPQTLADAPAAIHVITQEDIRRSGMTSIPEILRLAPGVDVARLSGNKWAVSARGFNNVFSNKMLVLIDGRSVYTPLFSGVRWDVQDTFLDDIERIEVIRGPGGSLWGANAVNGVINIITRNSRDSQGSALVGRLDLRDSTLASLRHGGRLGDAGHFRVYAKAREQDPFNAVTGGDAHDAIEDLRAGFRADWSLSDTDALTIQGDLYDAQTQTVATATVLEPAGSARRDDVEDLSGFNLLANWRRNRDDGSGFDFMAYFDRAERDYSLLGEEIDTMEIEFRRRLAVGGRHSLSWGLGYRRVSDSLAGSFTAHLNPPARSTDLFTAYVHDEIALTEDVTLTVGSKIEHNDFTGFEYQPSIRVLWRLNDTDRVWGAISRAVRTPSRAESDLRLNTAALPGTPLPTLIALLGNRDFEAENLLAMEIGYRAQPTASSSIDIAAFFNSYDSLLTNEALAPTVEFDPPLVLVPARFDNLGRADTFGAEVSASWQATDWWKLNLAYTWFDGRYSVAARSTDPDQFDDSADREPQHQLALRSQVDLSDKLDVNVAWYWVDDRPALRVSDYSRVDIRLAWRPSENLELSLTGQNVFDPGHVEYFDTLAPTSEIPRLVELAVRFGF